MKKKDAWWVCRYGSAATLSLSLLLASGCVGLGGGGSDGDDQPDAGATTQPFSLGQARAAGQILGAQITLTAKLFRPIMTSGFNAQCYTIKGDTTDVDEDSIPASASLTLDCVERFLGVDGTLTGTFDVIDTQPDEKAWAFTATDDVTLVAVGPLGGMTTLGSSGDLTASQGGGQFGGPYELLGSVASQAVVGPLEDPNLVITNGLEWTVSFAPELEWSAGAVPVVGLLSVDGSWDVGVNARSAEATLSTPEPLTFNPNCNTLLTGGIVRAELSFGGQPAVLRLVWSGCGTPRITFNDDP